LVACRITRSRFLSRIISVGYPKGDLRQFLELLRFP
jgi:hypothetical protein